MSIEMMNGRVMVIMSFIVRPRFNDRKLSDKVRLQLFNISLHYIILYLEPIASNFCH